MQIAPFYALACLYWVRVVQHRENNGIAIAAVLCFTGVLLGVTGLFELRYFIVPAIFLSFTIRQKYDSEGDGSLRKVFNWIGLVNLSMFYYFWRSKGRLLGHAFPIPRLT